MSKVTQSDVNVAVNKAYAAGLAGQAYEGLMPSAHDAGTHFRQANPDTNDPGQEYLTVLLSAASEGWEESQRGYSTPNPDSSQTLLDLKGLPLQDARAVYVEAFQAGRASLTNWTPWVIGGGIAAAGLVIGAVLLSGKGSPAYASNPRIQDPERCRKIVKLAAKKSSKFPSIKHWFEHDEKGFWELEADRLLEVTKPKAIEMGLTESQVDDQLAEGLKLMALEAELNVQMRKSRNVQMRKSKKNPAKGKSGVVTVLNLRTQNQQEYQGITPRKAVMAAYAQSRGDANTWDYEEKYGHLVRQQNRTVFLEDFAALLPKKNPSKKAYKTFSRRGRYVELIGTEGGNLILRPTEAGTEEAKEGRDIYEMLEDHMGNGWEYIRPEEVGALTDATIISQEAERDNFGDLKKVGRVYAHMNYMVEDPVATWAEGKDVFFQGA